MVLTVTDEYDLVPALQAAVDALHQGQLVAVPTETVYGLACLALDASAVDRLRALKGRGDDHPLPVQVASLPMVDALVRDLPPAAEALAARFWPGPLTLVCPAAPGLPRGVTAGRDTVGIRVPDHPVTRQLLAGVGQPLAVPSANRTGAPPLSDPDALVREFGDDVAVVLALEGDTLTGVPSTVVDVTRTPPVVLRQGGITENEVRQACSELVT